MANVDPCAGRHLLGAHVPAVAALWLWRRVEAEMRESAGRFERIGDRRSANALRFAADELEQAARQIQAGDVWPTSASGSAEPGSVEPMPTSGAVELTTEQAARRAGTSARWVRRWCHDEAVAARKVGRSWLVDQASLDDLLQTRRSA